jgi:hypothetical protein
MPFPLSNNNLPLYQDTGQGAAGRLASWVAWIADPSPMLASQTTVLIRDDGFDPVLDDTSTGATSGGDQAFTWLDPPIGFSSDFSPDFATATGAISVGDGGFAYAVGPIPVSDFGLATFGFSGDFSANFVTVAQGDVVIGEAGFPYALLGL